MSKSKFIVAAALALTGTFGAGMAQAHGGDDVQWSVTIGTPTYNRPAPVYVEPARVYTRPAPVYVEPAVVYGRAGYRGTYYREPTRWDRDGDGIPNRYDRVYNPRWDRDGDGVPNWRDHRDGYGKR